jgi:hypothetical protein
MRPAVKLNGRRGCSSMPRHRLRQEGSRATIRRDLGPSSRLGQGEREDINQAR